MILRLKICVPLVGNFHFKYFIANAFELTNKGFNLRENRRPVNITIKLGI